MNISSINSTNANTNFNGNVIARGKWPEALAGYFVTAPDLVKVAENSKYNIIGKMHRKLTYHQPYDVPIVRYKLTISAEKENPNLLDKIKHFLGLNPKVDVTRHHHREERYLDIIDNNINAEEIVKKLGIK